MHFEIQGGSLLSDDSPSTYSVPSSSAPRPYYGPIGRAGKDEGEGTKGEGEGEQGDTKGKGDGVDKYSVDVGEGS